MKIFRVILGGHTGFSLIEMFLAAGMTTVLVGGGAALLKGSVKSEKASNVQGLIDREFAAAIQIAGNTSSLAKFVSPSALGDCLTKGGNTHCAAFSAWQNYPAVTAANEPKFQATVNLLGQCLETDPNCLVARRMRYRWTCSADACSGLETEIRVSALQQSLAAGSLSENLNPFKERVTVIKLDRRQFFSRAQLEFFCDSSRQTMKRVDYDRLRDVCETLVPGACDAPYALYSPSGAPTCKPALTTDCSARGYLKTGLDATNVSCQTAVASSRAPASELSPVPPTYVPDTVTQTAVNTSVTATTTTATTSATSTGTNTSTGGGRWKYHGTSPLCKDAGVDPSAKRIPSPWGVMKVAAANFDVDACASATQWVDGESANPMLGPTPACPGPGATCSLYANDGGLRNDFSDRPNWYMCWVCEAP